MNGRSQPLANGKSNGHTQELQHNGELRPLVDIDGNYDRVALKHLLCGMLAGDRHLQRAMLDKYFTDDVKFVHVMGSVVGKDMLYYVYRCATVYMRYKRVEFIKILCDGNYVCFWTNCTISAVPFNWLGSSGRLYPIITYIKLRDVELPGGGTEKRIEAQIDHHSSFVFVLGLGHWVFNLFKGIINPLAGLYLVLMGRLADNLKDGTLISNMCSMSYMDDFYKDWLWHLRYISTTSESVMEEIYEWRESEAAQGGAVCVHDN